MPLTTSRGVASLLGGAGDEDGALPSLSSVSGGGGAAASASGSAASSAATSREAAAILAAVTAAIQEVAGPGLEAKGGSGASSSSSPSSSSGGSTSGVALLLAQLAARDAAQLRSMVPGIVAALRAATEDCLLVPHPTSQTRLRRVLRIIASLTANAALPVEQSAGELLAATCSVLLHTGTGAGAASSSSSPSSSSSHASASASSSSLDAVQDEARTRSYAAQVLGALVERSSRVWPEVRTQATLVLLDGLAEAVDLGGDGDAMQVDGAAGSGDASTVLVRSWEALYGAACGLACLRDAPADSVLPLVAALRSALVDEDGTSDAGGAGPVVGQWRSLCGDALLKALRAHGSGPGSSWPAGGNGGDAMETDI
jgi:hypothetical protein